MKVILKTLFYLFCLGVVCFAGYLSVVTTDNRETVKDVGFELEKLQKGSLNEPIVVNREVALEEGGVAKESFTLSISDIEAVPVNKGVQSVLTFNKEYYIYFTLNVTNSATLLELKETNTIGSVSSEKWSYKSYIPDGKSESDYLRVLQGNEQASFRYYIKTSEKLSDLGFYTSTNVDKDTYRHFIYLAEPTESSNNEETE